MHNLATLFGFFLLSQIALCVSSMLPAKAEFYIADNRGGQIGAFLARIAVIETSGETVHVSGKCLSSCTLILRLPPKRLCFDWTARLGFHAAWKPGLDGQPVASPEGTQFLLSQYPAAVHKWINRHGGLGRKMIYLQGKELAALYPICKHPVSPAAMEALADVRDLPPNLFGGALIPFPR